MPGPQRFIGCCAGLHDCALNSGPAAPTLQSWPLRPAITALCDYQCFGGQLAQPTMSLTRWVPGWQQLLAAAGTGRGSSSRCSSSNIQGRGNGAPAWHHWHVVEGPLKAGPKRRAEHEIAGKVDSISCARRAEPAGGWKPWGTATHEHVVIKVSKAHFLARLQRFVNGNANLLRNARAASWGAHLLGRHRGWLPLQHRRWWHQPRYQQRPGWRDLGGQGGQ